MLGNEARYDALNDLRDFCGDLRNAAYHARSYIHVEALSGKVQPPSLRRQPRYNPLDDRRYRLIQRADVRNYAVVYGFDSFRGGKRARAAHRGGHVAFNAAHFIPEAFAHARGHVAADFGEYR